MEPQTRYVQTADGTKMAAARMGSGMPLVMFPVLPG